MTWQSLLPLSLTLGLLVVFTLGGSGSSYAFSQRGQSCGSCGAHC